jgi:hypothetical protein
MPGGLVVTAILPPAPAVEVLVPSDLMVAEYGNFKISSTNALRQIFERKISTYEELYVSPNIRVDIKPITCGMGALMELINPNPNFK